MRLDAQVSFVDRAKFEYGWMAAAAPHMERDFTPDDLWRILSRNKYEGAIAVAGPGETDWLLMLAQRYPWIAGVVGEGLEDRWLRDGRLVGMRLRVGDGAALREAVGAGVAVELAVGADEVEPAATMLDRAAAGMRVAVVAEAGPRWDPAPWEALARRTGVMVKICGLINGAGASGWRAETYRPFVQRMLGWCGAGRVMYGSDWPQCMHTGTWKESLAAFTQAMGARTMEDRSRILGENAAEFYRRREGV